MEDDWDLHAVVRGCSAASSSSSSSSTITTTTATLAAVPSPADFTSQSCFSPFVAQLPCLPDPFEAVNAMEELQELYKPFFPKSQPFSFQTTSSVSSFPSSLSLSRGQAQVHRQQPKQSQATSVRSKKRKTQLKRVCHVPAEALSSDVWAWRKYGQKPIKGSPYPRGYYRCSSSKGCLARKQVERHRSDPSMFIVTYTAEHNHPAPTHRNSLAGSTRQKPCPSQMAAGDSNKASPSAKPATSSSTATSLDDELPRSVKLERESREDVAEDEEEGDYGVSDTGVSDDFFEGLEELASDCFSDQFPASLGIPWSVNNATAAASSI